LSDHPSFLDLDLVSLQPAPGAVLNHLQGCASCRAYVDSIRADPGPAAWLDRVPPRPTFRPLRPMLWAAALAALVLALVLPQVGHQPREGGGLTAKGAPSFRLVLKRGDAVRVLEPGMAVRPGDAIRIQVASEGYAWVAIVEGRDRLVYSGPAGTPLLPGAWRFDDAGGSERLTAVFSRAELEPGALARTVQEGTRSAEVWTLERQLEKEPTP
jgi:hypothetical protein